VPAARQWRVSVECVSYSASCSIGKWERACAVKRRQWQYYAQMAPNEKYASGYAHALQAEMSRAAPKNRLALLAQPVTCTLPPSAGRQVHPGIVVPESVVRMARGMKVLRVKKFTSAAKRLMQIRGGAVQHLRGEAAHTFCACVRFSGFTSVYQLRRAAIVARTRRLRAALRAMSRARGGCRSEA